MRIQPERKDAIAIHVRRRIEAKDAAFVNAKFSVSLIHDQNIANKITSESSGFTFFSDDPVDKGGDNRGPNPMEYMLAGMLSDLTCQFIRLSLVDQLNVEDIQANATAYFRRVVKGKIDRISFEIHLKSRESVEKVRALARKALDYSYAYNTLMNSIQLDLKVLLNNSPISL